MLAKLRVRLLAVTLVAAALASFAVTAIATPSTWNWKDQSGLLPARDGRDLSISSQAEGRWLLSDGTNLYLFDGSNLSDLTVQLRNRGMLTVSDITSDGRSWLISSTALDSTKPQLWITDGTKWTDVAGTLRLSNAGVDTSGYKGTWYVKTYQRVSNGQPSTWELSSLTGTDNTATTIALPAGVSANRTGCTDFTDGTHLCTGANTIFNINGTWYLAAGSSEARGINNTVAQPAKSTIWKIQGKNFSPISGLPTFKFISRVWHSNGHVMIATSNAVTNPFAADHLWIFDGTTLRDVSSEAIRVGLLSTDAREINAAWNGRSWMIIAGKKVIRFDESTMTREDDARDAFHTISADVNGNFVLGGAVSAPGAAYAIAPLTAKFITASEEIGTGTTKPKTVMNILLSKLEGPHIALTSAPREARIGNGRVFTFSAEGFDQDGIDHIDIYVNGARIKSCASNICEYTQTYWTNGSANRTIELYARAVDSQAYANDSDVVKLVVDTQSQAGAVSTVQNNDTSAPAQNITVPNNAVWTYDAASNISWTTWTDPAQAKTLTGASAMYYVAAKGGEGIASTEIWVNGSVQQNCAFTLSVMPSVCTFKVVTANYGYGTDVYMNANIRGRNTLNVWTSATTLHRDVAPVVATATVTREARGPVFTSTASIVPATAAVIRGTTVTFTATSQNNTSGLARVEIIANGKLNRTCTYGVAVGAVKCGTEVDTSTYPDGTALTFMARAVDYYGHEIMSDAKTVLIRSNVKAVTTTPTAPANGLNVWEWFIPNLNQLTEGQTATYSVGAWSGSAVRKIEMVVDGKTRKTCSFNATVGNRECSFDIMTSDYSHGHVTNVNARVTDGNGNVSWSEPRSILIVRSWEPLNSNAPYIQAMPVVSTYVAGSNAIINMQGWAPSGVKQIDMYVDGLKVTTCPTDRCAWTIINPTKASVEYSARMVDSLGREIWAPLYGLRKQ